MKLTLLALALSFFVSACGKESAAPMHECKCKCEHCHEEPQNDCHKCVCKECGHKDPKECKEAGCKCCKHDVCNVPVEPEHV